MKQDFSDFHASIAAHDDQAINPSRNAPLQDVIERRRRGLLKVGAGAAAAGLLGRGGAPALAQSTVQNWSGPYVGVFGGYNQTNDDGDEILRFDRNLDGNYGDPVNTAAGANAFSPGFCGGAASSAPAMLTSSSSPRRFSSVMCAS